LAKNVVEFSATVGMGPILARSTKGFSMLGQIRRIPPLSLR
jgi:hypothetical protein